MKYSDLDNEWSRKWFQFIFDNPDKEWKWGMFGLSEIPNITWDIIQDNPDKDWEWDCISENPNITWEIIQKNPDFPWDWKGLS